MILFIVGFLMVFGGVGGFESGPDAPVATLIVIILFGIIFMMMASTTFGYRNDQRDFE